MTNREIIIDERGKRCPIPVIELGKKAAGLPGGSLITVLSDDPAAGQDIAAWCRMRGATLISSENGHHVVKLGSSSSE